MANRDSGAFNQKSGPNTAAYDCSVIVDALIEYNVSPEDAPMQGIASAVRQFLASQSGTLTPDTWKNLRLTNTGIVTPAGHGTAL